MRTKFSQEMEEKKIRISFMNNEKNEMIKKVIINYLFTNNSDARNGERNKKLSRFL